MDRMLLKRELRNAMRSTLRALPPANIAAQSTSVAHTVAALTVFQSARNVAVFVSMQYEFDTRPILDILFSQGKRCFLPVVGPSAAGEPGAPAEMRMLEAASLAEIDSWKPNPWGIREPPLDDPLRADTTRDTGAHLDLILTPGLAFTPNGSRLGQGKGFYDRFFERYAEISRLRQKPQPIKVGLACSCQVLDDGAVPTTEQDVALDIVCFPQNEIFLP